MERRVSASDNASEAESGETEEREPRPREEEEEEQEQRRNGKRPGSKTSQGVAGSAITTKSPQEASLASSPPLSSVPLSSSRPGTTVSSVMARPCYDCNQRVLENRKPPPSTLFFVWMQYGDREVLL